MTLRAVPLWLCSLALLASAADPSASLPAPGDAMPEPLTIPTLDGPLIVSSKEVAVLPLVLVGFDPRDPFCRAMWTDPTSLAALLARAPLDASFLFFSHTGEADRAEGHARWMRQQLMERAATMALPPGRLDALWPQLHFATQPAAALGPWLPQLLAAWPTPRRLMRAHSQRRAGAVDAAAAEAEAASSGGLPLRASGRLDAFYGWIPWPVAGVSAPLALAGRDCDWIPYANAAGSTAGSGAGAATAAAASEAPPPGSWAPSLNGSVALVRLTAFPGADGRRGCTYADMLSAAEAAGAAAVLLAAPSDAELREVNCSSAAECATAVGVPATMVSHAAGWALQEAWRAGDDVNITFTDEPAPGLFAGIDAGGRLFEVGWPKFASLLTAVWAAEYQVYLQALSARLEAPALEVPLFKGGETLEGEGRLRTAVTLPPWSKLASHTRVEVDLSLSCPGATDADCPAWDHVLSLYACCEDPEGLAPPCDPCQPTVWGHGPDDSGSSGGSLNSSSSSSSRGSGGGLPLPGSSDWEGGGSARSLASAPSSRGGDAALARERPDVLVCGREIGRWMTPFRRRVGRWLTDVSALRPLLLPAPHLLRQTCTFTLQAPAWAGPWKPRLTLRFSSLPYSDGSSSRGGSSGGDESRGDGTRGSSPSGSSPEGGRGAAAGPAAPASGKPEARVLALPFSGGNWDGGYNARLATAFNFTTPAGGVRRAMLVSLITGHGEAADGCAEFCGTTHAFDVNDGRLRLRRRFKEAGTLWGCADQVLDGVVPNEHGTWAYGRNGWCDGQDVDPWVADITAALAPPGNTNSIRYRGLLLDGREPEGPGKAGGAPGQILMQSNLVLHL